MAPETYRLENGKFITIKKGDITREAIGAIVNPANGRLIHAGGAAAAISRAAGPIVDEQSEAIIKRLGIVATGTSVYTDAGQLPCRYVIHTVGPQMGEGDEDRKLFSAITSVLELATRLKVASVSIPAVSSGIFGFPKDRCAHILIEAARDFLLTKHTSLDEVVFCNYDDETVGHFTRCAKVLLGTV